MLYVLENNGVYGLTKGQFSASADVGTKSKRGEVNRHGPIDPVNLALSLGATFVARSFSGDKRQLVPILKAALKHKGFALVDVISPCVTFNQKDTFASYKGRIAVTDEEAKEELCAAYTTIASAGDQVPLGIFFQVKRPTLDGSFHAQAKEAAEKHGVPTMEQILESFA